MKGGIPQELPEHGTSDGLLPQQGNNLLLPPPCAIQIEPTRGTGPTE